MRLELITRTFTAVNLWWDLETSNLLQFTFRMHLIRTLRTALLLLLWGLYIRVFRLLTKLLNYISRRMLLASTFLAIFLTIFTWNSSFAIGKILKNWCRILGMLILKESNKGNLFFLIRFLCLCFSIFHLKKNFNLIKRLLNSNSQIFQEMSLPLVGVQKTKLF